MTAMLNEQAASAASLQEAMSNNVVTQRDMLEGILNTQRDMQSTNADLQGFLLQLQEQS